MVNEIVKGIKQYIDLTDNEAKIVTECIPIKKFQKGTILLREGQIARASYQNLSGLVRKYYIVNGEEITTNFYEENTSISSLKSLNKQEPSTHYFECIEDCKLAVLTKEKEDELIKKVPQYEALCRASVESDLGEHQEALANYLIASPEQRYINLLKDKPHLLNRVPLYLLASYIGVKPESLSRIRKRVMKNKDY
ncbi:MAG: cyclic nucleotide-binding protein [Flavobacteriaceae bacterium]|uniref:Crp/Fnr family transcriptional regulator n=1 Tax=Winogradskyella poriferorum TaxID=307627 RepID=UPI000C588830|nr:cyclic nucleotide-binding protein [Flavobacteriaceae bacterium]MBD09975.1 cyclic nucleotide-binding protein [Flavobacteriaceae bacterium]|tara:strand:- start:3255 stop:3839 length:585 start_codon:yes stop_codon:yes gene_type:complete